VSKTSNGKRMKEVKRPCRLCGKYYKGLYSKMGGCCSRECERRSPELPITNTNNVLPNILPNVSSPLRLNDTNETLRQTRKGNKKSKWQRNNELRQRSAFYKTGTWMELRYQVLEKYGRQCMACGSTKGSMHVDHIKPKSKYPHLAMSFNNLQVLCKDCNLGKSNYFETDHRPKVMPSPEVKVVFGVYSEHPHNIHGSDTLLVVYS